MGMGFMSPEVLSRHHYKPVPSDVWSMGVLLLEMFFCMGKLNRMMDWAPKTPPKPELAVELGSFFTKPDPFIDCPAWEFEAAGAGFEALLRGTLTVDPPQRWTMAQVTKSQFFIHSF